MKKAVLIVKMSGLAGRAADAFDYLYFGNELCPRRFPAFNEIKQAAAWCEEYARTLVLVTPLLTMETEQNIQKTLQDVHDFIKEVVVNDWGVLTWLFDLGYKGKVHLGRILGGGKRDPRLSLIETNLPGENPGFYQRSPWNPQYLAAIKAEFPMVGGVEYDFPLHGAPTGQRDLAVDFCCAIHSPYVYISGSRWCPFLESIQAQRFAAPYNGKCNRGCETMYGILSNPEFGNHKLLVLGNSLMVRNNHTDFTQLQPDRIIDNENYCPGRS